MWNINEARNDIKVLGLVTSPQCQIDRIPSSFGLLGLVAPVKFTVKIAFIKFWLYLVSHGRLTKETSLIH